MIYNLSRVQSARIYQTKWTWRLGFINSSSRPKLRLPQSESKLGRAGILSPRPLQPTIRSQLNSDSESH
ncbi:hypothetical protein RSOLAG1IB_10801 [Rhizoctonia solani AG-1 IB]|uniref:Uncharacterized protein n=1 Tax=Thanatephorus cucumeris (strain AG1-IB / isolate 7/3/14) TaxID=1108050 RepID=A0A0B7G301_THACB|nr:hypothetical protein RSOLAG1IB_10801 [Rhizoctonia solani AG-1 IB]